MDTPAASQAIFIPIDEWEEHLSKQSQIVEELSPGALPDSPQTAMKQTIDRTFHIVGGEARFAHWANSNYGSYARLFLTKLIPNHVEIEGELTFKVALPRSKLDE